jgi:hypothetical protein
MMTNNNNNPFKNRNVVFYGSGETNNQRRKTNNPLYRKLLEENWLSYSKVPNNKKMKESYVWEYIIHPIIADGGQFYTDSGTVLDESMKDSRKVLLTKVSQALRDYKKKVNYNISSRTPRKVPISFVKTKDIEKNTGKVPQVAELMF